MTAAALAGTPPASQARMHTILRFAAGTSGAFLLCEAMGWYPTFLAPLLAGLLLANLPAAPPLKLGVVLVLIQSAGAYGAYILTSLLHETPPVLFAVITLILLLSFVNLARGRGFLPILLVLISFATVPIVTMMAPQQAGPLPFAFARGMVVAVMATWMAHAIWPRLSPPRPQAARTTFETPVALAVTGVAIVLPLMLLYLMYGITDALPLLITTIVLVINFDPKQSAIQGAAMMIGNFIGGLVAIVASSLVQLAPTFAMLSLIIFFVALLFGNVIERGGPAGAVSLVTFNQAVVLFSLSMAPGGSDGGLWLNRLVQFGIACTFAIGMMNWLFPRLQAVAHRDSP
jgi:hypothetical protein